MFVYRRITFKDIENIAPLNDEKMPYRMQAQYMKVKSKCCMCVCVCVCVLCLKCRTGI